MFVTNNFDNYKSMFVNSRISWVWK